jgi:hypothetical protein
MNDWKTTMWKTVCCERCNGTESTSYRTLAGGFVTAICHCCHNDWAESHENLFSDELASLAARADFLSAREDATYDQILAWHQDEADFDKRRFAAGKAFVAEKIVREPLAEIEPK